MSGLTVYQPQTFAALDPTSAAKKAFEANVGEEGFSQSDLIRVKMPSGGALHWTVDGPAGPEVLPAIEGIIVYQARYGVLWPNDESAEGVKPVVDTVDMKIGRIHGTIVRDEAGKITGIETATDPEMVKTLSSLELVDKDGKGTGTVDWASLPYCQFGTGKKGIGKFAKEGRIFFILRKGSVLPLVVRTGPSAIGVTKKFLTQLELPYWYYVTSITLKEEKSTGGIKYSEPIFKVIGTVDESAVATIEKSYKDPLAMAWNAGRIQEAQEEAE